MKIIVSTFLVFVLISLNNYNQPVLKSIKVEGITDTLFWRGVFILEFDEKHEMITEKTQLKFYRVFDSKNQVYCDEVIKNSALPCNKEIISAEQEIIQMFMLEKIKCPEEMKAESILKTEYHYNIQLIP